MARFYPCTAAMFETVAKAFVDSLTVYAALGLLFALIFVWVEVERLDTQARGAGAGFRLLILPGVVAFWPLFLQRWARGMAEPPLETNPHRSASSR